MLNLVRTSPQRMTQHHLTSTIIGRLDLRLLATGSALTLLLVLFAQFGQPEFLPQFSPDADEALGLMWQVHAGFLAIAFAGLTIASQVYADSPLAAGTARRAILAELRVGRLLSVGLTGNLLIAVAAIWLPTDAAVLLMFSTAFLISVGYTVRSYLTLGSLYSDPASVDQLIGMSLDGEVKKAAEVSSEQEKAAERLSLEFLSAGVLLEAPPFRTNRRDVIHSRNIATISAIRIDVLRVAVEEFERLTAGDLVASETPQPTELTAAETAPRPRIVMYARPFRKLRSRTVLFSLYGDGLDKIPVGEMERVLSMLRSAVMFESEPYIGPEDRILWEMRAVQDAAREAFGTGALNRASRAIALLERANDVGWSIAAPGGAPAMNSDRRDWLLMPFADLEWSSGNLHGSAGLLIDSAISRSIKAVKDDDFDRFISDLVSFQRIWASALDTVDSSESVLDRILVALQNLAEFVVGGDEAHQEFRESCVWAFAHLVKESVDRDRHRAARRAADYLIRLYRYNQSKGVSQTHVEGARLALAAWLLLRRSSGKTIDGDLLNMLVDLSGSTTILRARSYLDHVGSPISRWEWWESQESRSLDVNVVEITRYADLATAVALVKRPGPLPNAATESDVYLASRVSDELGNIDNELSLMLRLPGNNVAIRSALERIVDRWRAAEANQLAAQPIAGGQTEMFRESIAAAMDGPTRLADSFIRSDGQTSQQRTERGVIGLNVFVPRQFFVDSASAGSFADPSQLGGEFARAMLAGEEAKLLGVLDSLSEPKRETSLEEFGALLADVAEDDDFLVLRSFNVVDFGFWADLAKVVASAEIELVAVDLGPDRDFDVLLVSKTRSIEVLRTPEEKEGMEPIGDTGVSCGVFDDVPAEGDPKVRVEVGELLEISVVGQGVEAFRLEWGA